MARTSNDPRRLLAVIPLVVCISAALVHAGVIMLPALKTIQFSLICFANYTRINLNYANECAFKSQVYDKLD